MIVYACNLRQNNLKADGCCADVCQQICRYEKAILLAWMMVSHLRSATEPESGETAGLWRASIELRPRTRLGGDTDAPARQLANGKKRVAGSKFNCRMPPSGNWMNHRGP